MSVLVMWASPNREGLTSQSAKAAICGLQEAGKDYRTVCLNDHTIERCRICGSGKGICAKGKCVIPDDFTKIYEMLREAEAVIFITPVYWHGMSEAFQAFLSRVRRSDPLVNHYLEGKKHILVAAAGKSGNGALRTLAELEYMMNQMKMQMRDAIPVTQLNKSYSMRTIKSAASHLCEELSF